ncbi:unnamed protein product [Fraxinus pennsylvanica]|uniref:Uncharacterized protein n=1 Tax=Fraxinus pennsylvanica TaxID=56036 RepID=A0AAD2AB59_9LAMI|nr:unnamed protein product [Fraxinus pennsylvanica]
MCVLASERWYEAIVKRMPIIIQHSSATVRAASITCFARMTSSVFFSLPKDKPDFSIKSSIDAALSDVPSVRSVACRAIGVIACFPQIFHSTEILEKFIQAARAVFVSSPNFSRTVSDSPGQSMDLFGGSENSANNNILVAH